MRRRCRVELRVILFSPSASATSSFQRIIDTRHQSIVLFVFLCLFAQHDATAHHRQATESQIDSIKQAARILPRSASPSLDYAYSVSRFISLSVSVFLSCSTRRHNLSFSRLIQTALRRCLILRSVANAIMFRNKTPKSFGRAAHRNSTLTHQHTHTIVTIIIVSST